MRLTNYSAFYNASPLLFTYVCVYRPVLSLQAFIYPCNPCKGGGLLTAHLQNGGRHQVAVTIPDVVDPGVLDAQPCDDHLGRRPVRRLLHGHAVQEAIVSVQDAAVPDQPHGGAPVARLAVARGPGREGERGVVHGDKQREANGLSREAGDLEGVTCASTSREGRE